MAKLQEKKFFKVIILIVVFCIPIIYSFFYLKSYWDPYGKLENMDVAIVNLDNFAADGAPSDGAKVSVTFTYAGGNIIKTKTAAA